MNPQNLTWKQRQTQKRNKEIRERISETVVGLALFITWLAIFMLYV